MTAERSRPEAADLLEVIRDWCAQHLPGLGVDEAEVLADRVGRETAAVIFETAVERDGHRAGYAGPRLPCACGQQARFVGYRGRWIRGVHGEVRVERAYYHCSGCGTGLAPWDADQGLSEARFTPRVKARVARWCARLTYRDAAEEVAEWLGEALAESTLEALTGEVGERLRAVEDARVQSWFTQGRPPAAAPLAARVVGKRAYLSIDAAKAHIDGSWHDVKVATFARGERRVVREPDGSLRLGWDTPRETQYLAVQEEAEEFARRVYVWALGLGAERAELVVLGDGAEWIWKLFDTHFTDALQILDYYHASEHVWSLARALFGAEHPQGNAWAERCSEKLQEAGFAGLLEGLRELRELRKAGAWEFSEAGREGLRREMQYFRRHRRRMRYPAYRAQGLMIGSGPVEAGCKSIVGQRLKGTGMRWSSAGADAVLAVRTAVMSQRGDQVMACARAA